MRFHDEHVKRIYITKDLWFLIDGSCFSWPKQKYSCMRGFIVVNYLQLVTIWLFDLDNSNHKNHAFLCETKWMFKLLVLKYSLHVLCLYVCCMYVSVCFHLPTYPWPLCKRASRGVSQAKRPLGSKHSIPSSLAVTLLSISRKWTFTSNADACN